MGHKHRASDYHEKVRNKPKGDKPAKPPKPEERLVVSRNANGMVKCPKCNRPMWAAPGEVMCANLECMTPLTVQEAAPHPNKVVLYW